MYIDTEGVVLKTVTLSDGRKLLVIFSLNFGKITAGSSVGERVKNKSGLAFRPFTHSKFELYKNRDLYSVNNATVLKSFFKIGEDIDKYMHASYVLEFTEKVLAENEKSPQMFNLLLEYMRELEERKGKYGTLTLGYLIKALKFLGCAPNVNRCLTCGEDFKIPYFAVNEGGILCEKCRDKVADKTNESLIFKVDFGIIEVIKYFQNNPLGNLKNVALNSNTEKILKELVRNYIRYHLDLGELKSENFLTD